MLTRFQCPACGVVIKATGIVTGKSLRCPKCREQIRVPEDNDDERDEIDEEDVAPRKRKPMKDKEGRGRKKGGKPLALWLGLGGAAAGVVVIVVVVLVIVLGGKRRDNNQSPVVNPSPEVKESGGSETHTIARQIDTNIPLPKSPPFNMIRGILSLGASADGGVISVTSAASPRKYTINRASGTLINEFNDPDDKAANDRTHRGRPPLVSPDGKLVIYMSVDSPVKTIKVREVATGNVVKELADETIHHFHRVAFSPKGDVLYAIVHVRGEIVLAGWSIVDWQQVCRIQMPENREASWIFPLADGNTVVTVTNYRLTPQKAYNPQVDLFDISKKNFVRSVVLGSYKQLQYVAISPDGKLLAVNGELSSGGLALEIYNLETSQSVCQVAIDPNQHQVGPFWFLPSGNLGVAASGFVAAYDSKTGEQKAIWKHDNKVGDREITHVSCCANGEVLLVLDGATATILVARLKE